MTVEAQSVWTLDKRQPPNALTLLLLLLGDDFFFLDSSASLAHAAAGRVRKKVEWGRY